MTDFDICTLLGAQKNNSVDDLGYHPSVHFAIFLSLLCESACFILKTDNGYSGLNPLILTRHLNHAVLVRISTIAGDKNSESFKKIVKLCTKNSTKV